MFFRKIPDNAGYAVMAGLQQLIEYIEELSFTKEDIEYLRGRKFSAKNSWNILKILNLNVIYGQFRKVLLIFPE